MSNDKHNKTWNFLKAKGYYLALALCAVAIGVAGYVYYHGDADKTPQTEVTVTTPAALSATEDRNGAVSAIVTMPNEQETTAPTQRQPMQTMWPVDGEVAAVFAADKLTYNETTRDWRVHHGVDLEAAAETQVVAAADGTVYTVYDDDVMGTTVVIRHDNGFMTTYSSLSPEVSVAPGTAISMGDVIGTVGQTALTEKAMGPHVHFAVTHNDEPLDPAEFINQE